MSIEAWLAFVAASTILVMIPGPTVLLVVSYALGQGWRAALPTSIGVALGDFTAVTLSLLGVGALLATSATLFTVLKLAGAAYLVWLGIKLWQAGGSLRTEARTDRASAFTMIFHAWIVTALNPKGITFFVAFMPQFIDPKSGDVLKQMLILGATFLVIAFANALAYGFLAARAGAMARNPSAISLFNKVGGSLLIGAGIAAATVRTAQS